MPYSIIQGKLGNLICCLIKYIYDKVFLLSFSENKLQITQKTNVYFGNSGLKWPRKYNENSIFNV